MSATAHTPHRARLGRARTVRVTDTVSDSVTVPDGDIVTLWLCDCDSVPDGDKDCVTDTVGDTDSDVDTVTDRHCVTEPVSVAIVGDADSVDPAGAQNGPMLNVARCVPSTELSGEPVATTDGEPVADARPVAIVCVTVGDTDCVKDCVTDTVIDDMVV